MLTHGLIPYAFETLATFWPNSRGQPSPSFVDGDRVHVQGSMCLKVWHLLNIFLAFNLFFTYFGWNLQALGMQSAHLLLISSWEEILR